MQKISVLLPVLFSLFVFSREVPVSDSERKILFQRESFFMPIEDVFSIAGIGTVVTGKVEKGTIKVGDQVELVGLSDEMIIAKVYRIEMSNKTVTEANKGENVGLVLSGVDPSKVIRGMVVCAPSSVKAYSEFKCQLSLFTKADGGRSTPVFNKYRPQFGFYTALVSGEITLPEGKDQMQPGESGLISVKLSTSVALEPNMDFNIREGGRIVGSGKIIELIK